MKLMVSGKEIPCYQAMAQESLDQYYTSYIIVVPLRIPESTLTIDSVIYHILREELHDNTYVYTVVDAQTYRLLNTTFPSVTGTFTIKQVLSKLGLACAFAADSAPCYWHIPSLKFSKLIEYLSNYTILPNGGATYLNLNAEAKVELVDLKIRLSGNAKEMTALKIDSDESTRDWITKVPGSITIYSYTPKGTTTSKLVLDKDAGLGIVTINDTTGYEEAIIRRELTTSYNINKYTARKIRVSCANDAFAVGDCVNLDKISKFIVYERVATIPLNGEPTQVSYVLVAPIL